MGGFYRLAPKVYLSGGTVTHWQDVVMHSLSHGLGNPPIAEFYNPASFSVGSVGRPGLSLYDPMDKLKIEQCDILFAYLEASNPTPINVALELGYAKGLGKLTILCNEWTEKRFKEGNLKTLENGATWYKPWYCDLLNSWADFCEPDFGIAQELLKQVVEYD